MLLGLDDVRMMAMVIICFILAIFSVFFPTDVLHDDEELCFDLEKLMLENYVEIKWIILLILIFFSFQCVWVDVFICLHLF